MGVRRKGKKTSETLRFRKSINLHTTLVSSFSTAKSWIVATVDGDIRDPLTSSLTDYNLPTNFTPSNVKAKTLVVSHNSSPSFDKLIVVPTRYWDCLTIDSYIRDIQNGLDECTLLVLHNGGRLYAYSPHSTDWGLVSMCMAGDSAKNITQSIPTAFTSCSVKRRRSDRLTTKFEGCDVRSDVVPTLQKIWRNHGNIIQNSNLRNRDMIARALEFLSDMIQILENNSALSLSDSQADCLTSTLSDLRCMHFEVKWLIPVIEKAIKLHKSKHLQESLNRISQSRSQVGERETALLEELAKVNEEKNKLKEEAAMVSIGIPFSGKYKFEELLGSGLT